MQSVQPAISAEVAAVELADKLAELSRQGPKWSDLNAESQGIMIEACRYLLKILFPTETPPGSIWVSSILDNQTFEAVVQVQWDEKGGRMSAAKARQMGLQFLEIAESAEGDEMIFRALEGNSSPQQQRLAMTMLGRIRELREQKQKERLNK